jgi:hypothetical protein
MAVLITAALVLLPAGASRALAATPAPAADPAGSTASANTAVRVGMIRVGVDHDIAAKGGHRIGTDANGVEYVIGTTPIGTDNQVEGPCGWSWFDWVDIDYWGQAASIYSGFEIRPGWQPAVFIEAWDVTVIDDAGVSTKHLAPTLGWVNNLMLWVSPRHRFHSSVGGWIYGEVTTGIVVLRDGTICFPLGPNDGVWLAS